MAILVDFSQTCIAAVSILAKQGQPINLDVVRHVSLNSLRTLRTKFKDPYGELVICCDGKRSWRKEFFPHYKIRRADKKANMEIPWESLREWMKIVIEELNEHFPYKVVLLDSAEGDDVIACLTKYYQENELVETEGSLFSDAEPQKVLIVSSDKDFCQLQVYKNVTQYSPMQNDYVKVVSPSHALFEKVLRGDPGDDVPSFLNDDNVFLERRRQKPLMETRLQEIFKHSYGDYEKFCRTDEEKKNFIRNRTLIDFNSIPQEVYNDVIREYIEANVAPRYGLMMYFGSRNLDILFEKIQEF